MGHKFFLILVMISIFLISGCSQTGSIINKSSESQADSQASLGPGVTGMQMQALPEETAEAPPPTDEADEAENQTLEFEEHKTEAVEPEKHEPEEPTNPCEEVTCPDSVTICDDGYKARCSNSCSNGICSICRPDCTGHDLEEAAEEACDISELSCGACEDANEETCQCDIILPCDGNDVCEEGEYPESGDCPDCDDSDECTDDFYDFGSGKCSIDIIVPCCGNSICENATYDMPENHTNCPEDCNASQETQKPGQPENGSETGNISILFIEQYDEWVKITNSDNAQINMANWTLSDAASHAYTFPDFCLNASSSVIVHTGKGTDNSTDLFWNRGDSVWNNGGDNATLENDIGVIVSTYSY